MNMIIYSPSGYIYICVYIYIYMCIHTIIHIYTSRKIMIPYVTNVTWTCREQTVSFLICCEGFEHFEQLRILAIAASLVPTVCEAFMKAVARLAQGRSEHLGLHGGDLQNQNGRNPLSYYQLYCFVAETC